LRLVAAFVWACSALISASASGGELGCKGWPRALGNTAKQRDSSDGMSLSLLSEARGAKRPRCDEAQEKSDWHVLIAMPDQMLTTVGYFGAAIPEGGEVTTEQWETFVDTHIARRLGLAPVLAPPSRHLGLQTCADRSQCKPDVCKL